MLKANALFIVIVMALIIGIFTGAIVLISFNYRLLNQQNLKRQRLSLNSVSAMNFLLCDYNNLAQGESKTIDLFGNMDDSVVVQKKLWGVFDIGIAKSFSSKLQSVKIFQVGYKPTGLTAAALYLVDDGMPLVVGGKTLLRGVCYLPDEGIKPGRVSGKYFTGTKLVEGEIRKSTGKLPALDNTRLDNIINVLQSDISLLSLSYKIYDQNYSDSVSHSFQDTTLLIYNQGPVIIGNKVYKGNILFVSKDQITVESSARLEDVIIVAPRIFIQKNFKGNLQAFATDTLACDESVELVYPSSLAIIKQDYSKEQPSITIEADSRITGFIFSYQYVEDTRRTLIRTAVTSKVHGQIYSDGYLDLQGDVAGGVMCRKIVLNTPATYYENHLLDVTIDNSGLSQHFLLPPLLTSDTKQQIVKWLK
jgi:hypothetical protein